MVDRGDEPPTPRAGSGPTWQQRGQMTETFPEPQQARAEQIAKLGRLSMRSQRDGEIHTISLRGELDLANAGDVEQELIGVEDSDARVILLDLSGLTFIDSTGIRLLVLADARSRGDGKRLVLRRPPEGIRRVLRITGVDELLPFAD